MNELATTEDERCGDWFQTFTSERFYILDPRPEEIHFEDIAHSLALQCRFNGHVRHFYSVAQHSVLVARCLSEQFGETNVKWLRTALFHDAAEAYMGDMVKPLKMSDVHFRAVERKLEWVLSERFDLFYPMPPLIKRADIALLLAERNALMREPPVPWRQDEVGEEPYGPIEEFWAPADAEVLFRQAAREYLAPIGRP